MVQEVETRCEDIVLKVVNADVGSVSVGDIKGGKWMIVRLRSKVKVKCTRMNCPNRSIPATYCTADAKVVLH